jgi:hypothetical protein
VRTVSNLIRTGPGRSEVGREFDARATEFDTRASEFDAQKVEFDLQAAAGSGRDDRLGR